MVTINGANIELLRRGQGRPILFLHPPIGLHVSEAFIAQPSEVELTVIARNREAIALFAWNPYMYNPKVKHRLHRIRVPTLFLWGEADRFAPPEYGRAYSALIPGARFELVSEAGHFPHIEQAERVARRIREEMK